MRSSGIGIDEASPESGEVAVADLRADPYTPLGGRAARPQQQLRVPGVEAAGDVGAGDDVEHGVVVTEFPHPEALAQIGVEIDGHVDQPTIGAGVTQLFSRHELAQRPPDRPPSISSAGRSGNSGTGPRHRIATGSASRACPSSSASRRGSKIDTHPIPRPSARAASHRFWIAHDTDARSICGSVRLPNTWALPAVAQCDDEQLGALQDALDLQREELVAARPQRFGGAQPFLVDDGVDVPPQRGIGDPDEPPRLHQPDARRGVCGLQQPAQHLLGYRGAGDEAAHIAAFGDHPVDRASLRGAERMLGHAVTEPRSRAP